MWGQGAEVINSGLVSRDARWGLGTGTFFFPLVLFKARHFRVENYLPSPSPHFTYKESLDLNFPLAYKALHDLASHVLITSLSSLTLPPLSSSPSLLPFFLSLLSLSPTSGPLHCLLPLPLPQIPQDSKGILVHCLSAAPFSHVAFSSFITFVYHLMPHWNEVPEGAGLPAVPPTHQHSDQNTAVA